MAIIVTEAFTGAALTVGRFDDTWQAARVFQVSGASSKEAAIAACASPGGGLVGAAPGYSHPANARLICNTLTSDDNPVLRKVTAAYTIPIGQFDPNPLNAATRWRWRPGNISEQVDADIYGNPHVNSAYVPFDPPSERVRGTMFGSAIRNEPYYDIQRAMAYQNTTNSDNFTVKGLGSETAYVSPGQACCLSVEMEQDFYYGMPFATVTYNFEFRAGDLFPGTSEYDGFFDARLDQGTSGWYDNGSGGTDRGRFCNAQGVELDAPVLLDGSGVPIDDSIRVIKSLPQAGSTSFIADPVPCTTVLPDNVFQKQVGDVWFLLYRRMRVMAFSSLGL